MDGGIRDGKRMRAWEPLPMTFFGKTKESAGTAAEAWWKAERDKEAKSKDDATKRAEARRLKRELPGVVVPSA